MSETAKLEEVYSALEESARLLDVPCSRDQVWPILTAYGDSLTEAIVGFSMAGGEHHAGELDYSITVPPEAGDPYAVALSKGLTAQTDHPAGALLADLRERCPLRGYAIDSGVVGGFKKIWVLFPLEDLQSLSKLADIPSMPRSAGESASFFARYDLDDKVTMIGVDYQRRTMNVYFGRFTAPRLEPRTVLSMLREIGLPEPDEQLLEFVRGSFSIYPTLSWDSSGIERICFAVITPDATALPAREDPRIGRFASSAPYAYAGNRILVYGTTLSPDGTYYKLGSYYQMPAEMWKRVQAFDAIEGRA